MGCVHIGLYDHNYEHSGYLNPCHLLTNEKRPIGSGTQVKTGRSLNLEWNRLRISFWLLEIKNLWLDQLQEAWPAAAVQGRSLVHSVWLWPMYGLGHLEECPQTQSLIVKHYSEMAVTYYFIDWTCGVSIYRIIVCLHTP